MKAWLAMMYFDTDKKYLSVFKRPSLTFIMEIVYEISFQVRPRRHYSQSVESVVKLFS